MPLSLLETAISKAAGHTAPGMAEGLKIWVGWHNLPLVVVEIGLTDLLKSAPPPGSAIPVHTYSSEQVRVKSLEIE